jgi:hypothetical protein
MWGALVVQTMTYGLDILTWTETEVKPLLKQQTASWRRLALVGGRAPVDITQTLLGIDCSMDLCRSHRLALFLRLLNSPPDSLQHVALLALKEMNDSWFHEVLADIRIIFPAIIVQVQTGIDGLPILQNRCELTSDGFWIGLHPRHFKPNARGHRARTLAAHGTIKWELQQVKRLTRDICRQFKANFKRERCNHFRAP